MWVSRKFTTNLFYFSFQCDVITSISLRFVNHLLVTTEWKTPILTSGLPWWPWLPWLPGYNPNNQYYHPDKHNKVTQTLIKSEVEVIDLYEVYPWIPRMDTTDHVVHLTRICYSILVPIPSMAHSRVHFVIN